MAATIDAVTFADPTGNYYNAGRWLWDTPEVSAPLFEILFGSAPGVQGSYSINLGFRSQEFRLKGMYVGFTADFILAQWMANTKAWVGPVDCTIGGIVLPRCFCDANATVNTPIRKLFTAGGAGTAVYAMYANIKMSCKGVKV